jgi:MFS family permease
MILAMGSAAFFLYSFSFLEHKPKYVCLNNNNSIWSPCLSKDFCGKSDVTWRIDYDDPDSIHNFIEQLDFYCEPEYKMGLFGSFFLLGIVIGCFTIARAGDIYGRRPVFIFGMSC